MPNFLTFHVCSPPHDPSTSTTLPRNAANASSVYTLSLRESHATHSLSPIRFHNGSGCCNGLARSEYLLRFRLRAKDFRRTVEGRPHDAREIMSTTASTASPTRLPQPSHQRNGADGERPEKSRRRSLLPQRTGSSGRIRTVADDRLHIAEVQGLAEDEETDAYTFRRRGQTEEADCIHDDEVARQRQDALGALTGEVPAGHAGGGEGTKVPSKPAASGRPSGLTRASSLRKPAGTAVGSRMGPPSAAASAVSRSHLRHASAVTGRPPSVSGSTTGPGRPPSASSIGHAASTRNDSVRRAGSVSEGSRSHVLAPSATSTTHVRAPSAASALQSKPHFSTYQQHFSPKKNVAPKPLTSSYLPAASVGQRQAASVEPPTAGTALQQAELLQLHLLHLQTTECLSSFMTSAEDKLRRQFEAVRGRCHAVQSREREAMAARNAAALVDWGSHERLQVLSDVLRELAVLQSDAAGSGRFDKVVKTFAGWCEGAQDIWEMRDLNQGFGVAEPMPDEWHTEAAVIERKVKHLLSELGSLDAPSPDSSAADIVSTARASLSHMGEELRAMKSLAIAIMEKESAWVDEQIEAMPRDA